MNRQPQALVVEDTVALAASLARGLSEEGFAVDTVATGAGALDHLATRHADLVVLDLGLPDIDGVQVLERARAGGNLAPVLVLTARDGVDFRVRALEVGADDYLVKPFAFDELVARMRALLRRAAAPRWAPLACGNLTLSASGSCAVVGGESIPLSPRERALLEMLLRRQGEVASRPEIFREVFGYDFDPGTNVIDVHISHLRRKLAHGTAGIETVRGAGYRLCESDGG